MNANKLTKKPVLITALLSVAAFAGYGTYRLTLPAPAVGSPSELPDIALTDLAGAPTPLTNWEDTALLVNFWATWCAPCLREIPLLKEFHQGQDAIEVVGIAVDRLDPVLEYAEEMQFNYPVLVGASGVAEAYEAMAHFRNEAQVMPFTAFTAPGGAVLGVAYGELHADDLTLFAETIDLITSNAISIDQARARLAEAL